MDEMKELPAPEQEGVQVDGTTWKRLSSGRMVMIDRFPEWEEKDSEDVRRYGYAFAIFSLGELTEKFQGQPSESAEHAYRRGYRDGWVQGLQTLSRLMFQEGFSRDEALDACWEFWEAHGTLDKWKRGNCAQEDWPPALTNKEAHEHRARRRKVKYGKQG